MRLPPECPWCRAPLDPADVDRARSVVRCRACEALTAVELTAAEAAGEGPPPVYGGAAARPEPPPRPPASASDVAPEPFVTEERGRELVVTWKDPWLGQAVATAVVCLLVLVLLPALRAGEVARPLMAAMPLIVAMLAVPLALMAMVRGRQVVECDGVRLRARSGSGLFHKRSEFARDELEQLHAFAYTVKEGRRSVTRYGLRAILADGTRQDLANDIPTAAAALWLERALERRLDIRDAYVEGQVREAESREGALPEAEPPRARTTAPLVASPAIEVEETEGGLELRWPNEQAPGGLGLFAALGFCALTLAVCAMLLGPDAGRPEWVVSGLLIAASALWLWLEARGQRRASLLRVEGTRLRSTSAPFLFFDRVLPRADVEQLYVYRYWESDHPDERPSFGLKAILHGGRHVVLARRLPNPSDARFVEAKLEAHLGIVDRAVREEYRKG